MKFPALSTLEWLQGDPSQLNAKLQLAVLIQPNCPGCMSRAIPFAQQLVAEGWPNRQTASLPQDISIFAVSTAFEDFEFNTVESARKLLSGDTVGVTRRALGPQLPPLTLPLAHDFVVDKDSGTESIASTAVIELAVRATRNQAQEEMQRQFGGRIDPSVMTQLLQRVDRSVLPDKVAHAFYSAGARGTPTWVLLHKESSEGHELPMTVLDSQFGHLSKPMLEDWIEKYRLP